MHATDTLTSHLQLIRLPPPSASVGWYGPAVLVQILEYLLKVPDAFSLHCQSSTEIKADRFTANLLTVTTVRLLLEQRRL